tara:strand:+ start:42 stop:266 length:225 start_codon:yes stop_codon:yes gene_type:complete
MNTIKRLEQLRKEYKKFRLAGYNQLESAEKAVNVVFSDKPIKPHIYKDEYKDASHIFLENCVYFFGDDIYKKQQ